MPHMVFIMMKKKWFTTYLLLTNPTAMLPINPLSPSINVHLLHTVLHMVLLERFFFLTSQHFIFGLSFHEFSWSVCLIRQCYCWEKLAVSHYWDLKGWWWLIAGLPHHCFQSLSETVCNPALILLPALLRLQSTHLNGPLLPFLNFTPNLMLVERCLNLTCIIIKLTSCYIGWYDLELQYTCIYL